MRASVVGGRAVKYELGDLAALDAGAVGALRAALELKVDTADGRFGHAFLAEVAKLGAVENGACRVHALGLDLDRVFEVHVEGVARAVGEELGVVLREHAARLLQLDLDRVIRCPGRTPVEPKADDEDAFIHAELDRVAATPVTPLIRPVRAGLESVADLQVKGPRISDHAFVDAAIGIFSLELMHRSLLPEFSILAETW